MPSRRRARELALQGLYSAVATDEPPGEAVRALCAHYHMPDELARFAERLAQCAWDEREAFDAQIAEHAAHWAPERLARVDRLILWLGLAEFRDFSEVPVRTTIDEAVDLAHKYSGAKAPAFVNGVLDAAARALGLLTPAAQAG